ncbi:MAG: hypothetical protein HOP15_07550, partial [Planctomycetes bacterium]|nr:hypothetical protein [Planctomycetota bacterium]
ADRREAGEDAPGQTRRNPRRGQAREQFLKLVGLDVGRNVELHVLLHVSFHVAGMAVRSVALGRERHEHALHQIARHLWRGNAREQGFESTLAHELRATIRARTHVGITREPP